MPPWPHPVGRLEPGFHGDLVERHRLLRRGSPWNDGERSGLHFVGISARGFAWFNVALVLVWILLNSGIAREHRKLVPDDRDRS